MKQLFLLSVALFSLSKGYCLNEEKISHKTYVQPEQVAFSAGSIFVLLGNTWLATESVHTDASGIYVTKVVDSFGWTCPKCGYDNHFWDNTCKKCGHR
jgi:hypothetical protein